MKELIENVVQWGRDRGLDKVGHLAQAKYTLKETAELLDAYADGDQDKINDAIGDILVTLIVGASNSEIILKCFSDDLSSSELQEWEDSHNFLVQYGDLIDSCRILMTNIDDGDISHYDYTHVANSLYAVTKYTNGVLPIKDCLQLAYDEIKNRKGKLIDGQFIKD